MKILGIESSCDETAAAIIENDQGRISLLSNSIASSQQIHIKYGGVVPEQASREQILSIIPVIEEALSQASLEPKELDAIAVTVGPGLIGSLLVGVETAKTLSLIWNKPLIPINHLVGHFYANWLPGSSSVVRRLSKKSQQDNYNDPRYTPHDIPAFPCLGLLVSGGHTDLVLFKDHGKYEYLGGTRDDAAGECFDKCARLLQLPYPGGPNLSKLAVSGDPSRFPLPRPMENSGDLDFSFSGLKTAVSNLVRSTPELLELNNPWQADLAASVEQTIVDVLVSKTLSAAKTHSSQALLVAGGVAANQTLRNKLKDQFDGTLFIPEPEFCTDNAAMIAVAGIFHKPASDLLSVEANPNLSLYTSDV